MMAYPQANEYIQAVQHPLQAFRLPDLRGAVFDVHPLLQIPMPASGNAAVVFKAAVAGEPTALRFFIREDVSSRERYLALGRHFETHGMNDCVAPPAWVDDAIAVRDTTWPVVRMTWVDGRTLDAYVGYLAEAGDTAELSGLAMSWRALVARLQAADFAHGDLQHGNILVDTASNLRLVDFDGAWIEAFASGRPPQETGHPNYQRTGREWGRWMDTFPGLVIYTALLALAKRPDAWSGDLQTGENILFASDDFLPPFRTPVWDIVEGIQDEQIRRTADQLRRACAPGWQAAGPLEQLLTGTVPVEISPTAHPTPIYDGPFWRPPDTTWWEDAEPSTPRPLPAPPSKVEPSATRQPTSPERVFIPTLEDWHPPAARPVGPLTEQLPPEDGKAAAASAPRRQLSLAAAWAIALLIGAATALVGALLGTTIASDYSSDSGLAGGMAFLGGAVGFGLAIAVLRRRRRP